MQEIILIGAGTQVKVLVSAARQAGMTVRAIYDDDPACWRQSILGVEIRGPVSEARSTGLPAVLAYDDRKLCKAMAETLDLSWATLIHPQAFVNPSATVGPGSVILEGAILQPSVIIGRHVLIAANATVAHDCTVGNYAHLWPGVDLAGGVHVGEGAFLCVGAIVIPNVRVGAWARVGPRAAVIRDVPDNVAVRGTPAKPVDDRQQPADDDDRSGPERGLMMWALWGTILTGLTGGVGRLIFLARRLVGWQDNNSVGKRWRRAALARRR